MACWNAKKSNFSFPFLSIPFFKILNLMPHHAMPYARPRLTPRHATLKMDWIFFFAYRQSSLFILWSLWNGKECYGLEKLNFICVASIFLIYPFVHICVSLILDSPAI